MNILTLHRNRGLIINQVVGCSQHAIEKFLSFPELIEATNLVVFSQKDSNMGILALHYGGDIPNIDMSSNSTLYKIPKVIFNDTRAETISHLLQYVLKPVESLHIGGFDRNDYVKLHGFPQFSEVDNVEIKEWNKKSYLEQLISVLQEQLSGCPPLVMTI